MIGLGILRLLSFLPLPFLRKLGAILGRLTMRLGKRRRHITEVNLKLCFPELSDDKHQQLLKQVFENTGMGILELAWCWYAPVSKLKQACTITGMEYIDKALAIGKGVLLLSFHHTSIELGGTMAAIFMDSFTAVYRKHNNPFVDYSITKGRSRTIKTVVDKDNMRKLVKSLKENKVVWYPADQDYGLKQGVFAPFFNIQAATVTAGSWFTTKTGATPIPMTFKRTAEGMHITLHPPLKNYPSGDNVADAKNYLAFLENYLKQYPADYMWVHRRFKTRPEGEKGFY